MTQTEEIVKNLIEYYNERFSLNGASPKGVGWRDDNAQLVRFDQLLKILEIDEEFVINDFGCGYGALFAYMQSEGFKNFKYCGYDLSSHMINRAKNVFKSEKCKFKKIKNVKELKKADYTVASGVFNLKFNYSDNDLYKYIIETLDVINSVSIRGFSFNCLTKYSDKHLMKDDLYYADPCKLFDHCKIKYSRNVALLHDYNIYDFTILVRKQEDARF